MDPLNANLKRIARLADRINENVGRGVAWLTVAMVVVQFLVVVLRYLFNYGSIAFQESITYMHALVFMLGAAYTLKREGHVRVDIYYRNMSARRKAWVDLLGTVFFLMPMFGFIVWISWDYVMLSWRVLEGSKETGGLPGVFLLKTIIVLMPLLMMLQGIAIVARSLLVLRGQPPQAEPHDEVEV